MRLVLVRSFALAAVLLGGGCSARISVDDYSRQCEASTDCTPAFDGEVCARGRCTCFNSAVSLSEQARFQEDFRDAMDSCPLTLGICFNCSTALVQCVDGTCQGG
jgi:hypothetical protein